jgi:hypothetical protein
VAGFERKKDPIQHEGRPLGAIPCCSEYEAIVFPSRTSSDTISSSSTKSRGRIGQRRYKGTVRLQYNPSDIVSDCNLDSWPRWTDIRLRHHHLTVATLVMPIFAVNMGGIERQRIFRTGLTISLLFHHTRPALAFYISHRYSAIETVSWLVSLLPYWEWEYTSLSYQC